MMPNGLGFTTLKVAFDERESADRVAEAFRRLALCGAKDDPF